MIDEMRSAIAYRLQYLEKMNDPKQGYLEEWGDEEEIKIALAKQISLLKQLNQNVTR